MPGRLGTGRTADAITASGLFKRFAKQHLRGEATGQLVVDVFDASTNQPLARPQTRGRADVHRDAGARDRRQEEHVLNAFQQVIISEL